MMEKSYSERFQIFDENYPRILEEIAKAAEKAGRKPEEITLLAATKTVPLEVINHAIDQQILRLQKQIADQKQKIESLEKENARLKRAIDQKSVNFLKNL